MEREGWEPGENELQPSPLRAREEHDSGCSSKSTFLNSVSSLQARLSRCLSVWWVLWTSTSCLFVEKVSGCEGTHFDHIKPWMWLGHTHKSGVLFEDGVIKLFPHILILWSFGRERSRRVKRQAGHTRKMLWVSCLSFIWVESIFDIRTAVKSPCSLKSLPSSGVGMARLHSDTQYALFWVSLTSFLPIAPHVCLLWGCVSGRSNGGGAKQNLSKPK